MHERNRRNGLSFFEPAPPVTIFAPRAPITAIDTSAFGHPITKASNETEEQNLGISGSTMPSADQTVFAVEWEIPKDLQSETSKA